MSERVFIDTNIFLYADDPRAKRKRASARAVLAELIREKRAVISTQVMQEYFVNACKKLGFTPDRAALRIRALERLDVITIRPTLILAAIELHRASTISFWDALIVKAASTAGCTRLISEDLSDGQVIDGVTITNPF